MIEKRLSFIFSIICLIFLSVTVAQNTPTYKENCIWWVKYDADELSANGNFTNPYKSLKNAINKITQDNKECNEANNVTRVIYIAASDKDDTTNVYTGAGKNTYISFDGIFEQFTILIQAIDQPTEYTFNSTQPLLPVASVNKYATFYGGAVSNQYIMVFQQCLTPFILVGLQFRDGGYLADDLRQSSVVVTGSSTVSFDSCLFRNNIGGTSGALFYNSQKSASMINCRFENNSASDKTNGNGGAIYMPSGGVKLTMENNIFIGNTAVNGGALYTAYQNLYMKSNQFINNVASISGGALYTLEIPRTKTSWDNLLFDSNKAINGSGLYDNKSFNEYYNATFKNNIATGCGGGGYFLDSVILIYKSVFTSNKAAQGGGVFAIDDIESDKQNQLLIKETNFTSNDASVNGGALYCIDAIARFNTLDIFESNTASNQSSSTDYCTPTCRTTPGDCGCPGGCGIKIDEKDPNMDAKIAVAIFIPITIVLLGVVGFLLWKTHSKSRVRTKVAPYDEIRLSPQSQDDDQL